MMLWSKITWLLFFVYSFAQPLLACSGCFSNKGEARQAFIWTTALLTFVPLILIGTGIYVVRRLLHQESEISSLIIPSSEEASLEKANSHE